jgi:Ca2+-binding EF-hand superfamily protein
MDFSVDDNSHKSVQAAVNLTGLLQVQLSNEKEIEWVERAQLQRVKQELDISTTEGFGGASQLQRGKMAKADWMITGQFSLLEKYDRNHDGNLDEKETVAMEKDPDHQSEQETFDTAELDTQIKTMFARFDLNQDGKLDENELNTIAYQVRTFLNASPEMLRGRKLIVAPLVSKDFVRIPELIKKYDSNHDGGLDLNELRTLARGLNKSGTLKD